MTLRPALYETLTGQKPPRPFDLDAILQRKKLQVKMRGPGSDLAASFLAGVATVLLARGRGA